MIFILSFFINIKSIYYFQLFTKEKESNLFKNLFYGIEILKFETHIFSKKLWDLKYLHTFTIIYKYFNKLKKDILHIFSNIFFCKLPTKN